MAFTQLRLPQNIFGWNTYGVLIDLDIFQKPKFPFACINIPLQPAPAVHTNAGHRASDDVLCPSHIPVFPQRTLMYKRALLCISVTTTKHYCHNKPMTAAFIVGL